MTLRALTIHRPYPRLILADHPQAKRIENRGRSTKVRGLFGLHSGQAWDIDGWGYAGRLEFQGLRSRISPLPVDHPTGVVAVAELVDVCNGWAPNSVDGCDCGPWALPGQYHWRLGAVYALPEPVPCKGSQGWWFLPPEVETAVRAQIPAEWWEQHQGATA